MVGAMLDALRQANGQCKRCGKWRGGPINVKIVALDAHTVTEKVVRAVRVKSEHGGIILIPKGVSEFKWR